jgi:radical SAM protein with 4Fe4S-binding SPASM domain
MDRVFLPPRCRTWTKDGWHIYFDPHNFVVVRVNDSGRLLLEMLRKYMLLSEIALTVSNKFGLPLERAQTAVQAFAQGLIRAGFLHQNAYSERSRSEFPEVGFPYDIYIHLTNKCNLQCPYCYNKTDRETKIKLEKGGLVAPTMSTDEFKHLITRLVENGVRRILFTGGEPLLRPDAMQLVAFSRERSDERVRDGGTAVNLEMLTNGTLIKPDVAEKMCQLLNTVTISLDGHEAHLHEDQRGQRTFEPTVRGVRTLVAKKKELGANRPRVCMVPALTAKNIIWMKEIFEYCLDDLKADMLAPIIFQAGDHQQVSLNQVPELKVFLQEQTRTNQFLEERNARLGTPPPKTPSPLIPRHHCGVGNHEISVDPGGFVYPCQSLHFNEFICGNVRETDIKEIYDESPVMKRMRGTTVETLSVCSHCDFKYLCNGGCRATAYNVYREFDHHNEIYCKMFETTSVAKLWAAAENQVSA